MAVKPAPAPSVPGRTEAERMSNAVRKMFSAQGSDPEGRSGVVQGAGREEEGEEAVLTAA